MIYITGDTHGDFTRIKKFCENIKTTKEDIMIILGDAGINSQGIFYDSDKKILLQSLPITIFSIHGNHEQRPETIGSYKTKKWKEGIIYYEDEYPNLLFAKDGEIFDLDGRKAIAIGGAYSIDKMQRIINGYGWWPDEQPSEDTKKYVESQLDKLNWKIDVVLSHTIPLKYEPIEVFMTGYDQSRVDKSTEIWLDNIEDNLDYKIWYCGHYHTNKKIDNIIIMFEDIQEFIIDTL